MYKEPLTSDETNRNFVKQIEYKVEKTMEALKDPTIVDDDFNARLYDLCVLNRMEESHAKRE
jgi:hypothetical protein